MKTKILAFCAFAFSVVSCSTNNDEATVQYFPFQETKNGLWGMISPSGEVLFSEEFKQQPTIARDNRFLVKNSEGLWEIYMTESNPHKVGKEYVFASMFHDGIALVTEVGEPISIINTDGEIIKKLDATIDAVRPFSEGYAIYQRGQYYGILDSKGNKITEDKYFFITDCSDGKFIALDKKYENQVKKDYATNVKFDVLDTSGNILCSLSTNKYHIYSFVNGKYQEGMLAVYTESQGELWSGIIDDKGNIIVKPTAKLKEIVAIRNKHFIYKNEEGYGLMNLQGETIIRAKYDGLLFASDDILVAGTKKEGNMIYKYIDFDDKQIGQDTYKDASPFYDDCAIVQISENYFSFIDQTGEQKKQLPDIVNIEIREGGDELIKSDYVNFAQLLDSINFTENGIDDISFNSTPRQTVEYYVEQELLFSGSDPMWYSDMSKLSFSKTVNSISVDIEINFTGNISHETYRTERVIDYYTYDGYYYHENQIPTGYAFSNVSITNFAMSFSDQGKLRHKLRPLYNELLSRFKQMGSIEKEHNKGALIKLNNSQYAIVYIDKEQVVVGWGNGIKPLFDSIDNNEIYDDIIEEEVDSCC